MATNDSESDVTSADIRDQRDRILASKIFLRSRRHSAFLDHIVNATLAGQADNLKEFALGIDVFDKNQSFDPSVDSIVRVEASRLRAKLREYYDENGANDPVRIDIPKGHYVPVFKSVNVTHVEMAPSPDLPFINRTSQIVLVGLLVVVVAFLVIDRYVFEQARPESSTEIARDSVVTAPITERSIAVLPFQNRSSVAEDVYFVDGIHDDILTQLSKLSSLDKVISRTSVEQYRDTTKSVRTIGNELGVVAILEGGIQRAGDRVRINVQLINAVFDRHLWSETYDRELTTSNIFAIQSEIATKITAALHTTLSTADQQSLDTVPTTNLRAYELYQQAQLIRRTRGLGSQPEIPQLLQEAISLDPDFVLAYVVLSRAYIDRYLTLDRDKSDRELARNAIDKAFALQPVMPEVRIALADYYYKGFFDYDRALEQLNFAIPLARGSSEAYALRAFIFRRRGDLEAAIPDLVRAIELDPGNFSPYYVLADTYAIFGEYAQAIALYDKSIELAPNNFGLKILKTYSQTGSDINSTAMKEISRDPSFAVDSGPATLRYRWEIAILQRDYKLAMNVIQRSSSDIVKMQFAFYPLDLMRGLTAFYLGERDEAGELFRSAIATLNDSAREAPEDPRIFGALGFAHAGLGERDEAIAFANKAYQLYPVTNDAIDGPLYVLNFAKTHAMLGEHDAAIQKLDQLLSQPSNWYVNLNVILREPAFEQLQAEPDFISMIAKYRRRENVETN